MTAGAMIGDLLRCFVPPPDAVQKKLETLAESIAEDARQDVIDKILETETASVKISIKHVVDACRALGVSYRETRYLPAEHWVCDCCGREFMYHQAPSDDERIDKNIMDFCPDCGFQPGWTILAESYKALGQKVEWYQRMLAAYQGAYGPGVKSHIFRIGSAARGVTMTRGGLFWARHDAEKERKESKRIAIEAKLSDIDRAKRWDIADTRE